MSNAVAYVRVSTEGQQDGHGLTRQQADITAYALTNGLTLTETYSDIISGKTVTRRGLERLRAARPAVIVISSVDRLARDMAGSFRLLSELMELGAELHSADVGLIDLSQDLSVMHFGMSSLMAHLEHSGIKRRTLNARIAKAEGGGLPSGIKLYGYLSVKGVAMEHPEHGPHLRRIFALAAETPFLQISDRYNAESVPLRVPYRREKYVDENGDAQVRTVQTRWHHATISQIVRNPAYHTGILPWGRYRLAIPPLVSEAAWRKAQRNRGPVPRLDWPLRGHLRCGRCGTRMSGWQLEGRYRCQRRRPNCTFGLRREVAEARVAEAVTALTSERPALAVFLTPHAAPPDVAHPLALLEQESAEAFAAWRRAIITADELALVRRDLEAQRRTLLTLSAPAPPDDALLDAVAALSPWEILRDLAIVATMTESETTLGLE